MTLLNPYGVAMDLPAAGTPARRATVAAALVAGAASGAAALSGAALAEPGAAPPRGAVPAAVPAQAAVPEVAGYRLRPGDTLSKVATRFRVPGGWRGLWAANRARIPDPALVRSGMVIAVPTAGLRSVPAPDARGASPAPAATPPATTPAGPGGSAAARFGWGTPVRSEDFGGGLGGWEVYDGPGHDGNGRRTPAAATVSGGVLTITGDAAGNSAGMAWGHGQKYGRWEARVRSAPGDASYHPVLTLWPDAENWPVGGEVDFMEISDPDRRDVDLFLHHGADNSQVHGNVRVDASRWHDWAVEWTPQGVTAYLDGTPWWHTSDTSILPPGPMHLTIQQDWFGGAHPTPSRMQVDWVRQYAL